MARSIGSKFFNYYQNPVYGAAKGRADLVLGESRHGVEGDHHHHHHGRGVVQRGPRSSGLVAWIGQTRLDSTPYTADASRLNSAAQGLLGFTVVLPVHTVTGTGDSTEVVAK
jgi:hypothetical protein